MDTLRQAQGVAFTVRTTNNSRAGIKQPILVTRASDLMGAHDPGTLFFLSHARKTKALGSRLSSNHGQLFRSC